MPASVESKVPPVSLQDFPLVRFGDFIILCASREDLVRLALADCNLSGSDSGRLVFDANGHALSLARTDGGFRSMVKKADIIHADGGFLVTLSKRLGLNAIPERSATTDMLHDFAAGFRESKYGFFLLGGEERVSSECARILKESYPGLTISGRRNGFFTEEEELSVVEEINESGAEILWVGLGKPKEQEFCIKWRHKLRARWIITCGGCFNYVTGDYPRAPSWMQTANLEWMHRLATRPGALFLRYITTTPHALWIALKDHSNSSHLNANE